LICIRWYGKYGISYRDLAEMMEKRGVEVDPVTMMRWVHRFAPELETRVRGYQGFRATSWRVDETYVKVGGKWKYLFRAVDKHGRLIDFMLAERRNATAAHRPLRKALKTIRHWPPASIMTDQLGSYPKAISRPETRGQAVTLDKASHEQVPERDHRSGSRCPQASYVTNAPMCVSSPPYVAVIGCKPIGNEASGTTPTPVTNCAEPYILAPSLKVMLPLGVLPPPSDVTVAVNTTFVPMYSCRQKGDGSTGYPAAARHLCSKRN